MKHNNFIINRPIINKVLYCIALKTENKHENTCITQGPGKDGRSSEEGELA